MTTHRKGATIVCQHCEGTGLKPPHRNRLYRRDLSNPEDRCRYCKGRGFFYESHWWLMCEAQRLAHAALQAAQR